MMDSFFFGGGFEIVFFLIFGVIAVMILVTLFRGLSQWNKNNHSPRLTVEARVVTKRQNISHHHSADQVMLDQLQLYGFEQCAGYYSVEPEPPSEAEYLGEGQWQLTFPLPSDDLYYNNFLELSLLDADGVEENSILISVPI